MVKTMTQKQLKDCLTKRLRLVAPSFHLETLPDKKLSGSIVSDTFKRHSDVERQKLIWDALDAEFGRESDSLVGTLLAYSQAEWNVDLTT